MSCPRCDSDDVRRSHTSYGLDRIGFRRYRCRTCRAAFWRWPGRHEAVRPRGPLGVDAEEDAGPSPPDWGPSGGLSPIDADLVRKRSETPPT